MGAFLDKPKIEKHNETGQGNGLRFGLSSMQGWRVEMEDAHTAMVRLPEPLQDWSFFAVFDGHAGAKVSAHCAEQLVHAITKSDDFQGVIKTENGSEKLENLKKSVKAGFLNLDCKMREMPDFISGEEKSGSTAIVVLVSPEMMCFANCGDSRGILCRDAQVEFFTEDHKPFHPVERERIQNAGGSVMIQRVNGSLAVSRALGDFEYKNVEGKGPCEQLVSPEPEINIHDRKGTEEFLVLACDGVWDVMSNDEVCAFVRSRMTVTDDLKEICNQVIDTCLHKGSRDNMSIVIVAFKNAPKVSEEAQKNEAELDATLEQKIKVILENLQEPQDPALLSAVMSSLSTEDIPNLPPGGGLPAKRSTVLDILKRLRPQTEVADE